MRKVCFSLDLYLFFAWILLSQAITSERQVVKLQRREKRDVDILASCDVQCLPEDEITDYDILLEYDYEEEQPSGSYVSSPGSTRKPCVYACKILDLNKTKELNATADKEFTILSVEDFSPLREEEDKTSTSRVNDQFELESSYERKTTIVFPPVTELLGSTPTGKVYTSSFTAKRVDFLEVNVSTSTPTTEHGSINVTTTSEVVSTPKCQCYNGTSLLQTSDSIPSQTQKHNKTETLEESVTAYSTAELLTGPVAQDVASGVFLTKMNLTNVLPEQNISVLHEVTTHSQTSELFIPITSEEGLHVFSTTGLTTQDTSSTILQTMNNLPNVFTEQNSNVLHETTTHTPLFSIVPMIPKVIRLTVLEAEMMEAGTANRPSLQEIQVPGHHGFQSKGPAAANDSATTSLEITTSKLSHSRESQESNVVLDDENVIVDQEYVQDLKTTIKTEHTSLSTVPFSIMTTSSIIEPTTQKLSKTNITVTEATHLTSPTSVPNINESGFSAIQTLFTHPTTLSPKLTSKNKVVTDQNESESVVDSTAAKSTLLQNSTEPKIFASDMSALPTKSSELSDYSSGLHTLHIGTSIHTDPTLVISAKIEISTEQSSTVSKASVTPTSLSSFQSILTDPTSMSAEPNFLILGAETTVSSVDQSNSKEALISSKLPNLSNLTTVLTTNPTHIPTQVNSSSALSNVQTDVSSISVESTISTIDSGVATPIINMTSTNNPTLGLSKIQTSSSEKVTFSSILSQIDVNSTVSTTPTTGVATLNKSTSAQTILLSVTSTPPATLSESTSSSSHVPAITENITELVRSASVNSSILESPFITNTSSSLTTTPSSTPSQTNPLSISSKIPELSSSSSELNATKVSSPESESVKQKTISEIAIPEMSSSVATVTHTSSSAQNNSILTSFVTNRTTPITSDLSSLEPITLSATPTWTAKNSTGNGTTLPVQIETTIAVKYSSTKKPVFLQDDFGPLESFESAEYPSKTTTSTPDLVVTLPTLILNSADLYESNKSTSLSSSIPVEDRLDLENSSRLEESLKFNKTSKSFNDSKDTASSASLDFSTAESTTQVNKIDQTEDPYSFTAQNLSILVSSSETVTTTTILNSDFINPFPNKTELLESNVTSFTTENKGDGDKSLVLELESANNSLTKESHSTSQNLNETLTSINNGDISLNENISIPYKVNVSLFKTISPVVTDSTSKAHFPNISFIGAFNNTGSGQSLGLNLTQNNVYTESTSNKVKMNDTKENVTLPFLSTNSNRTIENVFNSTLLRSNYEETKNTTKLSKLNYLNVEDKNSTNFTEPFPSNINGSKLLMPSSNQTDFSFTGNLTLGDNNSPFPANWTRELQNTIKDKLKDLDNTTKLVINQQNESNSSETPLHKIDLTM